ncbi:MAG: hypothetical protein RLZZ15_1245 [Verrucomicrobiota bacterium]|jgi:glycosyltransferase involved in cell wall biosynthesis
MSAPLLLDLTHTCHTRARTGIQRVARALHAELGAHARPVTHDPHLGAWRALQPWEHANLAAVGAAAQRRAHWPLAAKLRGHARRWLGGGDSFALGSQLSIPSSAAAGLLVPEIFSPAVAAALPELFAATRGPHAAIFYDAIALQYPEFTPAKTVARFPAYLQELRRFDGIAAISATARDALLDYWRWLGVTDAPPVVAIPLGVDPPAATNATEPANRFSASAPAAPPTILCVGTIEGRKNHLALLDACEALWRDGARFELRIVGLANQETGAAALARLRTLQAAGRALRYDGPLSDAALATAYATCALTVYPSLVEGFGLPVIESLAHGRPCVCSARGAIGESSTGGGCVALDRVDAPALADALRGLLASPEKIRALATAARARRFPSWADYARALADWMPTLRRRN